jgi:hypothetical protein
MTERSSVYECIDSERDYQEKTWKLSDDQKNRVSDWIIIMEKYIQSAKNSIIDLDGKENESVRKIAALAVACMEFNGVEPRI